MLFHKFVDFKFYMATIINYIYAVLHNKYAYINILFEIDCKLFSYFHSYISLNHVVHSHQQLFLKLLGKVCAVVYARALGLSLSIFNQHYLAGITTIAFVQVSLWDVQCKRNL